MQFEAELDRVLPADLPRRDHVIRSTGRHLELIVEANRNFNLTRITSPREAAIKHVLDSILPWRLFSGAKHILDAGTGAGFPGIPLALVLPETRFTLAESVQKKARFVDSVVKTLDLPNVEVAALRAEDVLRARDVDAIAARALAPIRRALEWIGPAIRAGAIALLYKGPDAETEMAEAAAEARKQRIGMRVAGRYELPDGLGSRTMVEIASSPAAAGTQLRQVSPRR
ncbi:MAG: 16S rRNA (guanine(527)-N(7))-methyltransferase RsmG [Bryobacteraceae bacterium]